MNNTHSQTHQLLLRAGPHLRPLTQIHAHLIVSNLHRSLSLLTRLLTLTLSSDSISYSHKLLSSIPRPDAFLFDSIIRLSSKSRHSTHSILFYLRMRAVNLPPSSYTFTSVVKACADLSVLRVGRIVHGHVLAHGFGLDRHVQTGLVVFYAKCGELGIARRVFDGMRERSVIAWNAMISGYEQNGFGERAIEVFYMMRKENAEIDSVTLVAVLSACSQTGALDLGRWVNDYILEKSVEINVVLGTSLVNMYARCGHLDKAREVFEELREKNVVAWTAMIAGYGMHGYGKSAIELFSKMKRVGPKPNDVTFVAVLSACAHAGLVSEGCQIFECMKSDYGLIPGVEHHVCMVDMYGRAGLLKDAMKFIKEHIKGEPGPSVWTAMVGACKMHRDFDLGVDVAERLLAVEPENPGHYVLLSNIYALAGRMDRVEKIRNVMIHRRLKKQTGYSSIEIDCKTYVFRMGDTSHPQSVEIRQFLDELIHKIKEAGYVPEIESVLHELEEEEREVAIRFHSEKLAVAFGIMSTGDGTLITIVKNLRMCGDCHLAIKYISVVMGREIVVRDKLRFHHFKEGKCSCQDYW